MLALIPVQLNRSAIGDSERGVVHDFGSHLIEVCGQPFIADRLGALYWPAQRALIVADLHLEKGSSRAARGALLPPYDTRATLLKLAQVVDRYQPEAVIALGDSLHDPRGAHRMSRTDLEMLRLIQADRDWIWLTGNHDPHIAAVMGGSSHGEITLAGLSFRHEPSPDHATHEIAAHMHPAAKLSMRGQTLRRPCFIGNGSRLILPAFGAFTGGLNVLHAAFRPLFASESTSDAFAVWMLGDRGLYPVATRHLRCD